LLGRARTHHARGSTPDIEAMLNEEKRERIKSFFLGTAGLALAENRAASFQFPNSYHQA
jgi:hypothetical protein